jgi:predicted nucleic acid-binding protein
MSFLLDTDIVSGYNKRTMPARLEAWLRANEGDSFISILSIAEMRFGLPGIQDKDHAVLSERIAQTEIRFLESLESLDADVLVEWKRLLKNLKTVNRTMTCEDSLLAATALKRGHTMVSINARHFEPAQQFGLTLENPLG